MGEPLVLHTAVDGYAGFMALQKQTGTHITISLLDWRELIFLLYSYFIFYPESALLFVD